MIPTPIGALPVGPHSELLDLIERLSEDRSTTFDAKTRALLRWTDAQSNQQLEALLASAGFIPEAYEHDSSEEKVYAKAMDILVFATLQRIGFDAQISQERSNAADVLAFAASATKPYSVVLDAKAFRLSRTALNPKDYKIEALSTWRKGADHAALVGPIAGFPEGNSRLFEEASRFNVALMTFSHLAFVLRLESISTDALRHLWSPPAPSKASNTTARDYWLRVDDRFCEAIGVTIAEWKRYRRRYFETLIWVADSQVAFYLEQERRIRQMDRNSLADLAVKAMKIEGRITTIRQRAIKTKLLLDAVDEEV